MKKALKLFYKVVLAGILYGIVAQIVHTLSSFASMDFYMRHEYLYVWSNIMMPSGGAPGALFYVLSVVFSIITGLLVAFVYKLIKKGIPGKTVVIKGVMYGLVLFLVAGIPGALAMILLINLPILLILIWALENLIIYVLGGMIIAALVRY